MRLRPPIDVAPNFLRAIREKINKKLRPQRNSCFDFSIFEFKTQRKRKKEKKTVPPKSNSNYTEKLNTENQFLFRCRHRVWMFFCLREQKLATFSLSLWPTMRLFSFVHRFACHIIVILILIYFFCRRRRSANRIRAIRNPFADHRSWTITFLHWSDSLGTVASSKTFK